MSVAQKPLERCAIAKAAEPGQRRSFGELPDETSTKTRAVPQKGNALRSQTFQWRCLLEA